jgi:hypothetical protein
LCFTSQFQVHNFLVVADKAFKLMGVKGEVDSVLALSGKSGGSPTRFPLFQSGASSRLGTGLGLEDVHDRY